jgi:hypothetical protein
MRPSTTKNTRVTLAAVSALLIAAAVLAVALNHGAARAETANEAPVMTYTAPTGPELSSSAAADTAVRYAREFGENGEVTIELASGTRTQASTLAEGGSLATAQAKESELRSATPSSTFCFGGQNASCSAAEQQRAKETLYQEGQAPTYLVAMSGTRFAPPERLPQGAKPTTGSTVVLLIDAHTGIRMGMSIGTGATVSKLGELQGASRYVAAPQSTTARAAGLTKPSHSHPRPTLTKPSHSYPPNLGSVRGTFGRKGEVVVFHNHSVFARTRVADQRFHIARIFIGRYKIAGRLRSGRYCRAKSIVVLRRQETLVHLTC